MAMGSKKYAQKIWRTRLLLVLVLCACAFMVLSVMGRIKVERDAAARKDEVLAEQQQLEERKKEAAAKAEYIQTEESVEMEIRKNFDVAKEGETVVVLMADKPEEVLDPIPQSAPPPWWMFWR